MEHIAIMRKSWRLTEKILTGKKKIESRWYKVKYRPWDAIEENETVYFKDSGNPVTIKAEVEKIIQFTGLVPEKVKEILDKYGRDDGIEEKDIADYYERFKNKRYCILVFLKNPKNIEPFNINKNGFGAMSAWITIDNVEKIKI
jgi:ASC-1-like (ASCH) protein